LTYGQGKNEHIESEEAPSESSFSHSFEILQECNNEQFLAAGTTGVIVGVAHSFLLLLGMLDHQISEYFLSSLMKRYSFVLRSSHCLLLVTWLILLIFLYLLPLFLNLNLIHLIDLVEKCLIICLIQDTLQEVTCLVGKVFTALEKSLNHDEVQKNQYSHREEHF
jgi:hypothetical protein